MNDSLLPTGLENPDAWTFWEIIYSDPELVLWDMPSDAAVQQPAQ